MFRFCSLRRILFGFIRVLSIPRQRQLRLKHTFFFILILILFKVAQKTRIISKIMNILFWFTMIWKWFSGTQWISQNILWPVSIKWLIPKPIPIFHKIRSVYLFYIGSNVLQYFYLTILISTFKPTCLDAFEYFPIEFILLFSENFQK